MQSEAHQRLIRGQSQGNHRAITGNQRLIRGSSEGNQRHSAHVCHIAQPPPCKHTPTHITTHAHLVAPIADHNPRTGRSCAPSLGRSVQHIGGGGAGAHNGEPGGHQGDGQGTPPLPPPLLRRVHHSPPTSSLLPSPITIHVQDGMVPLHHAACHSTSVAVVQALITANPEAAKATDEVRRPSPPSLAAPRASEAPQRVIRGSSEANQAIRG